MAHAVGMRLLAVPEANEDTEYAECHPQRPCCRTREYRPQGDEDLTPGDGQKHQRSGVGPFAMETEPLPIERAAHDTDSNERCHDANDGTWPRDAVRDAI